MFGFGLSIPSFANLIINQSCCLHSLRDGVAAKPKEPSTGVTE